MKTNPPKVMEVYDILEVNDGNVKVNGKVETAVYDAFYDGLGVTDFIPDLHFCPLCHFSLLTSNEENDTDNGLEGGYKLWYCRRCRFWQWHHFTHDFNEKGLYGCPAGPKETACISKSRDFDMTLPPSCNAEIAQYIRRNPDFWNSYNSHQMERLVADIFRSNHRDSEVIHIGKPDDGGIDVLFIDSVNCQWLIQVKRREKTRSSEGVSTVRNMIGALVLENSLNGIIVSTADHFTLRAQQAVKKIENRGMRIVLVDKGKLDRMLDPVLPDRPWLQVARAFDPLVAERLDSQFPSEHQLTLFNEGG